MLPLWKDKPQELLRTPKVPEQPPQLLVSQTKDKESLVLQPKDKPSQTQKTHFSPPKDLLVEDSTTLWFKKTSNISLIKLLDTQMATLGLAPPKVPFFP